MAIGGHVTATFSEQVQASTISFVLKTGATTVPATVSYNPANRTVTLAPTASLAYATTYTATLSGAQDLAGNAMSPVSWTFTTTSAPDTTAPTVTSQGPAPGATGVAIASPVTATFSEQVQASTISFVLKNGSTTVPATLSYDSTFQTVTLTPSASLVSGTIYTATLSGAKDLSGNTMSTVSWSFTTSSSPDTVRPVDNGREPCLRRYGSMVAGVVSATFSEDVQAGTISLCSRTGRPPCRQR